MSKKNEKKSWTFVPERSRPPANRRATKRKTTIRAITFVQDWDPSPKHAAANNTSQKKSSHKKDRSQPSTSLSIESSIRESPIAELVRSSPGPIIVARRVAGSANKSFRSPHPLSPATSVSSLISSSSKKKNAQPVQQGKTGVSPLLSEIRTRGKPPSGRKRRSPRNHGQAGEGSSSPQVSEGDENLVPEASRSGVGNDASTARLQDGVIDSIESDGEAQVGSSAAKKNKRQLGALSEAPSDDNLPGSPGSERSLRSTASSRKKHKKKTPDGKPSETQSDRSIPGSPISERSTRSVTSSRQEQNKKRPEETPDVIKPKHPGSERSTRSTSSRKEQKDKRSDREPSVTPIDVSEPGSVDSGKSSTSRRSRKRRGPSLTFQKKSRKGKTSLSFHAEDNVQSISISINERISSDDGRSDQAHEQSGSDSERWVTRSSPQSEQASKSPSRKGSAEGKTKKSSSRSDSDWTDVPVEGDIPTPGSARIPQRTSTSSDRSRSSSSRRKRGPSLTFKKKSAKKLIAPVHEVLSSENVPSSSSHAASKKKLSSKSSVSDRSSPEDVTKRKTPSSQGQKSVGSSARSKKGNESPQTSGKVNSTSNINSRRKLLSSSSRNHKESSNRSSSSSGSDTGTSKADSRRRLPLKGPRSVEKTPTGKPGSKKKNSVSRVPPQELGKTPDRSMSFFAATPKSGHVVRHQPKTKPGSKPGPGPSGQRKRGSGTAETSSDEEPAEKRAKVRLYTTGARARLVGDTTDLDILFNCVEDTALDFRESLEAPRDRRAVTKFYEEAKQDVMERISMQHKFKLQTLSLSRTNTAIRKYRNELLNLQRESARLDVKIADLKKKQENSDDIRAKMVQGIDSFVSDLTHLHKAYVSKYPKDIKSMDPATQEKAETLYSKLNPTLELQSNALNNKLREWMGFQTD